MYERCVGVNDDAFVFDDFGDGSCDVGFDFNWDWFATLEYLTCDGRDRFEGSVDGRVFAAHVEVGSNGSVTDGVVADTAVIHGRVQRGIVVRDRLALGETAVVVGDVSARRLSVMEGGGVNGTIRMGQPVATEVPREMLSRGAAEIEPDGEAAAAARSEAERDTLDRESRKPVLALSKEPAA